MQSFIKIGGSVQFLRNLWTRQTFVVLFIGSQCGNYGNSLSRIFSKNFVTVTVLLNKLPKSWFHEIFLWWWERISRFSTLCTYVCISQLKCGNYGILLPPFFRTLCISHWNNSLISLSLFLQKVWIFRKNTKNTFTKFQFGTFRAFLRRSEQKINSSRWSKIQNNHSHT